MRRSAVLLSAIVFMVASCSHGRHAHTTTPVEGTSEHSYRAGSAPSRWAEGYLVEVGVDPAQGLTVKLKWKPPGDSVRLAARNDSLQKAKASMAYVKASCDGRDLDIQAESPGVWVTVTEGCEGMVTWEWRFLGAEDSMEELSGSYLVDGGALFLVPEGMKGPIQVVVRSLSPFHAAVSLLKEGAAYVAPDVEKLLESAVLLTPRTVERHGQVVGVDLDSFDMPPGAGSFAGRLARVLDSALALLHTKAPTLVVVTENDRITLSGRFSVVRVERPSTMPFIAETRAIRRLVAGIVRGLLWKGNERPDARWWTLGSTDYLARLAMERSALLDSKERIDLIYWEQLRPLSNWVKFLPQPLTVLGAHVSKQKVAKMVASAGSVIAFYIERHYSPSEVVDLVARTPAGADSKKILDMMARTLAPTYVETIRQVVTNERGISQISLESLRCSRGEASEEAGALGMRWGIKKGMALVADVYDGPAKEGGIEPGDELLSVNGRWILSMGSLARALVPRPATVEVLVRRNGTYPRLRVKPARSMRAPALISCE